MKKEYFVRFEKIGAESPRSAHEKTIKVEDREYSVIEGGNFIDNLALSQFIKQFSLHAAGRPHLNILELRISLE